MIHGSRPKPLIKNQNFAEGHLVLLSQKAAWFRRGSEA